MRITQGDLWVQRQAIMCAPAGPVGRWTWDPALTCTPADRLPRPEVDAFSNAYCWPTSTGGSFFAPLCHADHVRLKPITARSFDPMDGIAWLFPTTDLTMAAALARASGWQAPQDVVASYAKSLTWVRPQQMLGNLMLRLLGTTERRVPWAVLPADVTLGIGWTMTSALQHVRPALRPTLWGQVLELLALVVAECREEDLPLPDLSAWASVVAAAIETDPRLLPALLRAHPTHPVVLATVAQQAGLVAVHGADR